MSIKFTIGRGTSLIHCNACEKECGKITVERGSFHKDGEMIGTGYAPTCCDKYVQTHSMTRTEFLHALEQNKLENTGKLEKPIIYIF